MNLAELQRRLMAVARANRPDDRVPYALGRRILARLASERTLDVGAIWARALWHGAASCVAIMLLLAAWSFFTPANNGVPANSNAPAAEAAGNVKGALSQDFENALLAGVDQETDNSW